MRTKNKKRSAEETGKQGGLASRASMTAKQWSEHCSLAAQIRWWRKRGGRDASGRFCPRPS